MAAAGDAHVRAMTWDEAIRAVRPVNRGFAELLRGRLGAARRGRRLPIFRASYRYGAEIVANGAIRLPCAQAGTAPCPACRRLARALGPRPVPLVMSLDRALEVSLHVGTVGRMRRAPRRMSRPGEFFGLFGSLDRIFGTTPALPWDLGLKDLHAGARSLIVAAGLGDRKLARRLAAQLHDRLGERAEPGMLQEELAADDWNLVRRLDRLGGAAGWSATVLVFPAPWIADAPELAPFWHELVRAYWLQSRPLREHVAPQADFAHARAYRRTDEYLNATAHLLISISRGGALGYSPLVSEESAPFRRLHEELLAVWPVPPGRGPFPFLLRPAAVGDGVPFAYYSLLRPSLLEPVPPATRSHAGDLVYINSVLKLYAAAGRDIGGMAATELRGIADRIALFGDRRARAGLIRTFPDFYAAHARGDFADQLRTAARYGWTEANPRMFSRGFFDAFARVTPGSPGFGSGCRSSGPAG